MINKSLGLALMLVAGSAMAAGAEPSTATAEPAVTYEYGMKLDIKRVISITPIPNSCKIEPATMVYEDSQRHTHTLNYQVMGECLD